jgi:hypothetical protein
MKNSNKIVSCILKRIRLKPKWQMIAATICFFSGNVLAIKISDYKPYRYDVSFTNPICQEYFYETPLETESGKLVKGKPKNAYCKPGDFLNVDKQKNNPHDKILQLIRDPKTKEIFMSYLSFSKKTIIDGLCEAIKTRNIKFTLVVDENNRKRGMDLVNSLAQCPNMKEQKAILNYPLIVTRGQSGRGKDKIGFSHNKIILINATQKDETRTIVFSSGNMSNGTTTHHENWHFLTTSSKSYFFQVHLCLKEGLLNHYASKSVFAEFIKGCRSKITVPEESDLKAFFVPGEGIKALEVLKSSFEKARTVRMATHRFSNKKIISFMRKALKDGTEVKLLLDDDLYWIGKMRRAVGRNNFREFVHVDNLVKEGLKAQYIETYADDVLKAKRVQLQHNKFFIFDNNDGMGSVFTGAGNITNSAFEKNFENFYLIKIPSVYFYFRLQYFYLWTNLGTSAKDMPTTFVLP